jgi:hypothetical protein
MKSNERTPIWPYLIVVGCLFALSIAAPRSWQRGATARRLLTRHEFASARAASQAAARQAVVLRAQMRAIDERWRQEPVQETRERFSEISFFKAGEFDRAETNPEPSPQGWSGKGRQPSHFRTASTAPATVADETVEADGMPANEPVVTIPAGGEPSGPVDLANDEDRPPPEAPPGLDEQPAVEDQQVRDHTRWPLARALIEELEPLAHIPQLAQWAARVEADLVRLAELPIERAESSALLTELRELADGVPTEELSAATTYELTLARLALLRRLDVWEQAGQIEIDTEHFVSIGSDDWVIDQAMRSAVASVDAMTRTSPRGEGWRTYLMLSSLDELSRQGGDEATANRQRTAKRVLARISSNRLSREQRRFLARDPIEALARQLRLWAAGPVEVGALLHSVETYEADGSASAARAVAEGAAVLGASRKPTEKRLGRKIEQHYRNANLRVVLTSDLLNRLLPQPPPATERINERVVGVPARGVGTTKAHLVLRLFPDNTSIRLGIEADGVIESQTASTAGPVTFLSHGESKYSVGKLIVLDKEGLKIGEAGAKVENRTRLSGMETDYDGVPILGSLVRNYALSEHAEKQGEAKREVEAKVSAQARARLDAEVDTRLRQVEVDFRERVLSVLERLELDPTIVQMSTTQQRLTARLRFAAPHQAGAHTPRPVALSNSLASVQLHESALNNALDQLQLAGRTFTLTELYHWIGARIGREIKVDDDLPEDVSVTFAEEDPIRLHFDHGRVEVVIAIDEIQQRDRAWYDIEAVAWYRPQIDGLRLEFVRDGAVELVSEEHRGRTEIVLRGIFNKVFSSKRKLKIEPAINPQNEALARLEFSSAVVENGWVSVTVAEGQMGRHSLNVSSDVSADARP